MHKYIISIVMLFTINHTQAQIIINPLHGEFESAIYSLHYTMHFATAENVGDNQFVKLSMNALSPCQLKIIAFSSQNEQDSVLLFKGNIGTLDTLKTSLIFHSIDATEVFLEFDNTSNSVGLCFDDWDNKNSASSLRENLIYLSKVCKNPISF